MAPIRTLLFRASTVEKKNVPPFPTHMAKKKNNIKLEFAQFTPKRN